MPTTIYLPTSIAAPEARGLARSPGALAGLRIGVLDNGKANAGVVMSRAAASLATATGATVSLITKKGPGGRSANAAIPCAPDIMERLVDEADVIITGAADCGSCTAYSVSDAIELERLGRPAVVVTTTEFRPVAETMAANFGLADTRLLVLPHPLGGTDADTLQRWADSAIGPLTSLITGASHLAVVSPSKATADETPVDSDHISHGGPSLDDDRPPAVPADAAVASALTEVRSVVAADGGELRVIGHDSTSGTVVLQLVLTDPSCADCVMPAQYIEQLALTALASVPDVHDVTVNDPR